MYQLDLRVEVARSPVRRLCALVLNLPSDSETAEACEHWHKPRKFDMDATVIEYLHAQFMQQRRSAGDKSRHKPFQFPRPWERIAQARQRRRPTRDANEIKRFFQRGGR